MKHFLRTSDLETAQLRGLVDHAMWYKAGTREKPLDGKSIALVFFNPSLRTRTSMQIGIYELGGNPVMIDPGTSAWALEFRDGAVMDGDKAEHIAEFVKVLGRYVSGVGIRTFAELKDWEVERTDPVLAAFARHSTVPLINLESAMHHPCQAMADMMTIHERLGPGKKNVLLTWAWHPKPLPMAVPNSFALATAQFGHDLTIAHPPGYDLDGDLIDQIKGFGAANGGGIRITTHVGEAFDEVDVVYVKSWGSSRFYGAPDDEVESRRRLRKDWIVDEAKMERTRDAVFMHCLPVRRNVIVTDGVIDSPRSVVIDEAENRLHIQKAILAALIK